MTTTQTIDPETDAPTYNLIRSLAPADSVLDMTEDGRTLYGHFSVFDDWYPVESRFEGTFMERVSPGAFAETLARGGQKVLYNHGMDPSIGDKPLGAIVRAEEDDYGAAYEVRLSDTSYNRDLIAVGRDGLLGASFRFSVPDDGAQWVRRPTPSDHNPRGMPERTITRAEVMEFGPVPWPANDNATAMVRSRTDMFAEHMFHDPEFVARLTERTGAHIVTKILAELRAAGGPELATGPSIRANPEATGGSSDPGGIQRRALVRLRLSKPGV